MKTLAECVRAALGPHVSELILEGVLRRHLENAALEVGRIERADREALAAKLESAVALFSDSSSRAIRADLRTALSLERGDWG